MASKVNLKFVIALTATVLVLFAVVAYVGYSAVNKSAADHAKEAEQFEAKAEWEKAAGSWSKAVNRNRTSVEYLKRWFTALSKWVPQGSERYKRAYREGYMLALQGWAEQAPTDVAVQRQLLDILLTEVRLQPNSAAGWEFLETRAEGILKNFPETDPNREQLRRYLGIARTYRLTTSADPTDKAIADAEADLLAALKADPTDALSAAAYLDWHRINIIRERVRGATGAADEFAKKARAFAQGFVAQSPIKLPVMVNLVQFELGEQAARSRGQTVDDVFKSQHERLAAILDQALAEPTDKIDRQLTWSALKMAVAAQLPGVEAKSAQVLKRLIESDPTDMLTLFNKGEIELALNQHEQAIATYQQLFDTKDLPLSQQGLLLFDMRAEARARQADAALAMWQRAREEAEKGQWLEKTRGYAKAYTEAAGPSTARGRLLEAKLKFAENDLTEARRLLGQYLEQITPPRSDASALKLLAEVLRRQQSLGGAREQLEQALKLNPNDIEAIATLADIETQLNNVEGAQARVEQVLALNPGNERAKARLEEIRQIRAGDKSSDPVVRALSQIGAFMQKSPPDFDGARRTAAEIADTAELTPRMARMLANRLVVFDNVPKAKEVLEKALTKNPDDQGLKADLAAFNSTDPLKSRLDAIEAAAVPDVVKAMMRFQTFNAAGDAASADKEFARARELEPEHPLVVGLLFDRALAAKDQAEARRLAGLATTRNLDKVNGLVFRTRLEMFEGRPREAAALAQQAVDADPLNPVPWRLLGAVRMEMGQYVEGITAFEKAVAIRPNDSESLKGLIRARISAGQLEKALQDARQAVAFAAGDNDIADMWTTLEGEVEGGDRARAVEIRKRQFERSPNDVVNLTELVQLLIRMERFEEAGQSLEALKKARPDLATAQLEALWHFGQGRVDQAIATVQAFMDSVPAEKRDVTLVVTHARFLTRINQLDEGLKVLERNRAIQSKQNMEIDREIGDIAFAANRYQEAADAYGRALASVSSDDDNRLALRIVEALNKLGQFADAEARAGKLVAGNSPVQQQAILLLRAEAAEGLKDRTKAADFYNRAVAADTSSALGYFKRGVFLSADDQTRRDAIADFEQSLRVRPDFYQARLALATVLLAQKDEDKAVSLLREGLARDGRNTALREQLFQALVATGRPNEAVTLLDEARQKSQDPRWRLLSAQLAERMNEFDKAVGFYGEAWALVKSPDLAARYADGLLRAAKPDVAKAKSVLADPAARTDEFFPLLLTRAQIARIERRSADAETDVKAAFARVDQTSGEQVQLFFQTLRSIAGPQDIFTLIDRLKPAGGFGPMASVQIARLKMLDPKLRADGLKDLDAALADTGARDRVLPAVRTMGDLLYFEKQYDAAAEVYRRLLGAIPGDTAIQNNLAYTLSKHLNRHEEALPLAEKAAAEQTGNANTLDTLGSIQLALGRLTDAEATLNKALAVSSAPREQVPVLLHLAEVKLAQSDRLKAEDYFEQAQRAIVRDPRVRNLFDEEVKRVDNKLRGR